MMIRTLVLLLSAGLHLGCRAASTASAPPPTPVQAPKRDDAPSQKAELTPEEEAQHLFIGAAAEVATGEAPTTYRALRNHFPRSPWTAKAKALIKIDRERRDLAGKAEALGREGTQCSGDREQLLDEVEQLRTNLNELKRIAIEMEMRGQ